VAIVHGESSLTVTDDFSRGWFIEGRTGNTDASRSCELHIRRGAISKSKLGSSSQSTREDLKGSCLSLRPLPLSRVGARAASSTFKDAVAVVGGLAKAIFFGEGALRAATFLSTLTRLIGPSATLAVVRAVDVETVIGRPSLVRRGRSEFLFD